VRYPPVKGLAELLLLREGERSVVQLMAIKFKECSIHAPHNVYMDETEKDDTIGVAGVVGTFENWISFEDRWRKALPQEAHNDFHYTDFWARRSYGAEWSNEKRLEHIKELASIISDCASLTLGFVFLKSMYENSIPPEHKTTFISPFHFCLAYCLAGVLAFYEDISPQPPKPLHVMFDEKNEERASIAKTYFTVKGVLDKGDILGGLSLGHRKQEPPLQAADLVIGELRRQREGHKSEIMPILSQKYSALYAFPSEDEFARHVEKIHERLVPRRP